MISSNFSVRSLICVAATAALCVAGPAMAQERKASSPKGHAATQIGGTFEGRNYEGGKWIEVDYSRPILRQREGIFGTGEEYGKKVTGGAPVWRAGADQTTRFRTEAALEINGKRVEAGEYSLFVELKDGGWTLILSTHKAQAKYDPENKKALWGSYGYDEKLDVVRAPMQVMNVDLSVDQFTIGFINVSKNGGELAMWWGTTMAAVPFKAVD